jgi:hypothetical protein
MTTKTYRVLFARSSVGRQGLPLSQSLRQLVDTHGTHLPVMRLGGDGFQFREMHRTGSVWHGTFVKLRDDAPHVVTAEDIEEEIFLQDGSRIIEKCHFLYRERSNALIWQYNKSSGGLSRAEEYLSWLHEVTVTLPRVMDIDRLDEVLNGQIYEIEFGYDRPPVISEEAPRWNQAAFDMMSRIDAAYAKFTLRAPRLGTLSQRAGAMVRQLVHLQGPKKVRVRLTDETDPIELFMAPLKDSITVELVGRYPVAQHVYHALEEAFDRHSQYIRDSAPG